MTISVSQVYPSQWISPDDVSRPFTVVIAAVSVEEFRRPDGGKDHKIVLAFAGARKRLPLNKTQAKALAAPARRRRRGMEGTTIILAPATAPNRKATIAVRRPSRERPAGPAQRRPTEDGEQDPDPID